MIGSKNCHISLLYVMLASFLIAILSACSKPPPPNPEVRLNMFLLDVPRFAQDPSSLLGRCIGNGEPGTYPYNGFLGVAGNTVPSNKSYEYKRSQGSTVKANASIEDIVSAKFGQNAKNVYNIVIEGLLLTQPNNDYDLPFANCKLIYRVLSASSFKVTTKSEYAVNFDVKLAEAIKEATGIVAEITYNQSDNSYTTTFGTNLVIGVRAVNSRLQSSTENYVAIAELGEEKYFRGNGPLNERYLLGVNQMPSDAPFPPLIVPQDVYCINFSIRDVMFQRSSTPRLYCPSRDELIGDIIPEYVQDSLFRTKIAVPGITYSESGEEGIDPEGSSTINQMLVSVEGPIEVIIDSTNNQLLEEVSARMSLKEQVFEYTQVNNIQ